MILGVLANRAIKRTPDVLTGARLANTGIALGLIFGLTVITYTAVQTMIVKREAKRFASDYVKVIKEGSFGDALLYREPADRRKERPRQEKEKEFEQTKARDRMMLEMELAAAPDLRKAVASERCPVPVRRRRGSGHRRQHRGRRLLFRGGPLRDRRRTPSKK